MLYSGQGLKSLQNRRWCRKLSFPFTIPVKFPPYYFNLIILNNTTWLTRGSNNLPLLSTKHNSYFLSAIKECNKLDVNLWRKVFFRQRILTSRCIKKKTLDIDIFKDSTKRFKKSLLFFMLHKYTPGKILVWLLENAEHN